MKNIKCHISLSLNIVFLIGFITLIYTKREKIYDWLNPDRTFPVIMMGTSMTGNCDWKKELDRPDVITLAIGGCTTFNIVGTLLPETLHHSSDICFIEGGINDIDYSIPLSKTYMNFNQMVDTLQSHHIKPVLQSTFYCNHPNDSIENMYVDSLNMFLVNLANAKKIRYLNVNQYLSDGRRLKKEYTIDGYHLTEAANKIWAREVKKILVMENSHNL